MIHQSSYFSLQVLDISMIYDKIVKEGRGGWCCELNGLVST